MLRTDERAIPARAISSDGNLRLSLKIHALEEMRPRSGQFEKWKLVRNVTKKKSQCIDRVAEGYAKVEKLDPQAIQATVSTGFGKQFKKDRAKKIQLVVDGVVAKRSIFQSAETLRLFRELCTLLYQNRRKNISDMNAVLTEFASGHEEGLKRLEAELNAAHTGDTFFTDLTAQLRHSIILNRGGAVESVIAFQEAELKALLDQLDPRDTHSRHRRHDRTWRNSAPSDFYAPVPRNTPVSPQQLSPGPAPIEKQQDSSSHIETTSGSIGSKNTPRSDQGSGGSSLTMNDSHGPSIRSQGTPVKQQTDTPVSQSGATLLSSPLPKEAVPVLKLSEGAFKEALVNDLEEYATEGVGLYGEDVWNLLVAIANSLGDTKDPFDLRKLAQSAGLEANTEILREAVKKQAPPDLEFIALVVQLAAKAHLKRAATAMATGILHQAEPRSPPPSQPKGQEKHSD